MSEDEFRTDLEWPTDPFGERQERDVEPRPEAAEDRPGPATEPVDVDHLVARLVTVLDEHQARLRADLREVRSEVAALRASVEAARAQPAASAGSASAAPSLAPVLEEIDRVREEIASLKRRISLRAEAQADAAVLTDEQLDRIARTVAGLLSRGTERPR